MKSERRHELQHNALADWLVRSYEAIQPYGNTIFSVLALVLLVLAGWLWWTRQSANDRVTAWGDLFQAQNTGDAATLNEIAAKYQGSEAANWAALASANLSLASGAEQLFHNKSTATQDLNKAADGYQKALKESQQPELRQQATFGLAQAYEGLCGTQQADLDKAVKTYEILVREWPNSAFAKAAQRRLDELKQPATKAFYDQLAKYEPKPALPGETDASGKLLNFDSKAIPEPGTITLPTLDGSAESKPAESKPAESKPAESKDAAAEKADTKPAESSAPAVPVAPPENQ